VLIRQLSQVKEELDAVREELTKLAEWAEPEVAFTAKAHLSSTHNSEVQHKVEAAVRGERAACAKACEESGNAPSSLWEEPGCWSHASRSCADRIRDRNLKETAPEKDMG